MNTSPDIRARCVVVGGGPAGMLTGYLLARAGVDVVVLEKHGAFNRDFRADLVIGADGRHALTHTRAGFDIEELGVPIDVLWMHISKREGDPEQLFGFFRHGKLLVLINRDDYYQAGFVIPKGGIEEIKQRGLPALYDDIVALAPLLKERITELDEWSELTLLTVHITRLRQWCRVGLVC